MRQNLTMATAERRADFRELLDRHHGIVFKVAATYARDPQDRADIVQEIAAQLWRSFPTYDGQRAFSTWMYRIALNVAISMLRDRSRREENAQPLAPEHEAIAEGTDGDERVRLLYRCIEHLEPLNRALLLLYLDERSHTEIADALGLTVTNVATKIGRLKQRLRAEMIDN